MSFYPILNSVYPTLILWAILFLIHVFITDFKPNFSKSGALFFSSYGVAGGIWIGVTAILNPEEIFDTNEQIYLDYGAFSAIWISVESIIKILRGDN